MPGTARRIKGQDRLILLPTGSEVTAQSGTATYVAVPVASKLAIITQPAGAVDGAVLTTQPVIELQTAGGAPVLQAGVTVTASIVAGAGSIISGASAVTAANGRATFTTLGIDASAPPASFTLRFDDNGGPLTSVDSSSFTVDASGGTLLLQETFADANFAARGWFDNAGTLDRVTSPVPAGFPGALRFNWANGATAPTWARARKLFTATQRVYLRYQIAVSSNWIGSGHTYHPHIIELLSDAEPGDGIFGDGPSDNVLAIYSEVNYQSGNKPRVHFQDNQNIVTGASNLFTPFGSLTGSSVAPTESRSVGGINGRQGYADNWDQFQDASYSHGYSNTRELIGPVVMDPLDTTWHTVEVEVVPNTIVGGVTQVDGICRLWWDGVLLWTRTIVTRTNEHPTLGVRQFGFFPYMQDGSPLAQQLYIGDLEVWTAKPTTALTQLGIATQPAGAVDAVAFTTQPSVQLRDSHGGNVSTAGVTITAGLLTGSGSLTGTVTAVTDSTGRATWTNLGVNASSPPSSFTLRFSGGGFTVDSASFSVSAGGGLPELPSGLTLHASYPVNPLASSGWGYNNRNGTATYVANSPPELDLLYPFHMVDGNEPSVHYRSPGANRIFWTYEFRYSAGFVGHSSQVNKHTFLFGASAGVICYTEARFVGASATGSLDVQFQDASTVPNNSQRLGTNFGSEISVTLTDWNRHSVFWDRTNSQFKGWVNGALYGTVNGMNTQGSGEYQIAATWGGNTGEQVPADQHLYIRNLQIWVG